MRNILLLLIIGICSSTVLADDAGTYSVQDGAAPWSDRVGTWELGDVPDTLKSSDSIPQQLCTSRSLTITGKPSSITVGVSEADAPAFKAKYPDAKETGDKLTIRHPKDTSGISYLVMNLPTPAETISGGDTAFQAGLVLLKIDTGATTAPTAPTTAPTTTPTTASETKP